MYNPIVNIIRNGQQALERALFSDIHAGDTFFCRNLPITAGEDAHVSGDASYEGYLVYDASAESNSWFPEDLD